MRHSSVQAAREAPGAGRARRTVRYLSRPSSGGGYWAADFCALSARLLENSSLL